MSPRLDETHDPRLRSWVPSARDAGTDFPLQNLPLGVFRRRGSVEPRIGAAIGGEILDLPRTVAVGALGALEPALHDTVQARNLNPLMALGRPAARALRGLVHSLLREDSARPRPPEECLVPMSSAELLLPAEIGDYTDFYASIHHAMNVGSMFRPDQPLMPNYKWVPIGYHGRASSVVASGTPIRRPRGQVMGEGVAGGAPEQRPTAALDYECEVAAWVGRGNPLGEPVPIAAAEEHLFGLSLLDDWSARDVQRWEYQPLGPFLAKSFGTTVSPWVVTLDALEPFRVARAPRPEGDPGPLPYLDGMEDRTRGGLDLALTVSLRSARMREEGMEPMRVSCARFAVLYWTVAQLLTHHASNGCNLRPGDLLASGTVSGPAPEQRGCLLERTWRGTEPLALPTGESRRFLEDGDEVVIRGRCTREGFAPIGFGECRGVILPASEPGHETR
ncbi:MAG TPA: fumarylacetoacetase [Gemmatimonadales bacterium]|jgi:fumarylacetoacetase|nr:fumarylacetoacetase [Gemmatimonadales bacterium]